MKKVVFQCKLITPMFMYGADSKTPELRASEFKGMMRFWWRAIRAEDNIENLRKEEASLFGGTGEGEGRSRVKLRVFPNNIPQSFIGENFGSEIEDKYNGLAYLMYSTFTLKVRGERLIRKYVKVKNGFDFNIEISSSDEEALKQALASFWLSVYLGGFGTRARRGGGNITISKKEGEFNAPLSFIPECNSSSELAIWIRENFRNVYLIINNGKGNYDFCTSYSNLSFSRFVIAKEGEKSAFDALNKIGEKFNEFRKKNKSRLLELGVFGIPVIVKGTKEKVLGLYQKGSNTKYNRRASPLIFKILYSKDRYYWLVLWLTGEFLPEGSILGFKDKTQKPDYEILDDFLRELKQESNEYILSIPEKLNKAIEKIKKQLDPDKIILFGSRARGDAHKKSDIDIAVDTYKNIQQLDIDGNFDIVKLKDADTKIKEKIERGGVILDERENKINS